MGSKGETGIQVKDSVTAKNVDKACEFCIFF